MIGFIMLYARSAKYASVFLKVKIPKNNRQSATILLRPTACQSTTEPVKILRQSWIADAIGLHFIAQLITGFVKAFAEYSTGFANNKNWIMKGSTY